jgi:hypothetical protein
MRYIKLSTLEYPLYEGDIRLEHPEITEDQTYPDFPIPDTYAVVNVPDTPDYDSSKQTIYQSAPEQVNGVWSVQWIIRDLTTEELASMKAAQDFVAQRQAEQEARLKPKNKNSGSTPNAI